MVNIFAVVNFLIELSNYSVTNLKIQKLLFYIYGAYLAVTDERPFDEQPEAWQYGPVFPDVYHELKMHGKQPIHRKVLGYDPNLNNDDIKRAVEAVFSRYGHLSEARLIQSTHKPGSPWAEVYSPDKRNLPIPDEKIKDYFNKYVIKRPNT